MPPPHLTEIIQTLRAQKPALEAKYGINEVGVFGSYVRQEQRPDSDLDILIEFAGAPRIGLLALIGLENELSDLLGVRVDLVVKRNLKRRISEHILSEVIMI